MQLIVRKRGYRLLPLVVVGLLGLAALVAGLMNVSADPGSGLSDSPYNGADAVQDRTPQPIGIGVDASQTKNDDALGQGSKDDISCPTSVLGSIPPNKSDISQFSSAIGVGPSTGHTYLYLSWNRINNLGTANFSFEFNRGSTACPSPTTSPPMLVREANDLLVLFDFAKGDKAPFISTSLWQTSGTPSVVCQASNTVPCWGKKTTLVAGQEEASIAASHLFGEAVVDLDNAGVPLDPCQPFSHVFVKGRSSASFTAELKDVAAPIQLAGGTTCSIIVRKFDGAANPLPGAGFTFTPNPSTGTGSLNIDDGDANDQADANDGVVCADNVKTGTYSIQEYNVPAGFTGDPATKTVTVPPALGTCAARLAANPAAEDIRFVNTKGSIVILKVKEDGSPLGGASFEITVNPKTGSGVLTVSDNGANDADPTVGTICVTDARLSPTAYVVHESVIPAGYEGDVDHSVTVSNSKACATTDAKATFVNKQGQILIHKISAKKTEAGGDIEVGGACFTLTPDPATGTGGPSAPICDNGAGDSDAAAGFICIVPAKLANYTIHESTVPANYAGDTDKALNVTDSTTCATRRSALASSAATFVDTPLSKFQIIFTSLAGAGITNAQIVCNVPANFEDGGADTTAPPTFDDTNETFGNGTSTLLPGSYNCTIDIDP